LNVTKLTSKIHFEIYLNYCKFAVENISFELKLFTYLFIAIFLCMDLV